MFCQFRNQHNEGLFTLIRMPIDMHYGDNSVIVTHYQRIYAFDGSPKERILNSNDFI